MKTLPFFKIRRATLIVAVFLLVGGIGYRLGERNALTTRSFENTTPTGTEAPSSLRVDFSLFWDVWQRLKVYYIDAAHIDAQKMVWGAISGMVNSLEDPYTVFLPPKENKEFKEDIGGSFQGIGAQLGLLDNKVIIQAPLKGSPAERAGLLPLDWIVKVDEEETAGWTLSQAVSKIRGSKGTTVTLTILHEKAEKTVDISVVRDDIVIPSVESWVNVPSSLKALSGLSGISPILASSKRIAYIALSRFGDRTNDEWMKAVSDIAKAQRENGSLAGLVLDLRNNPGGYLDGAVFIASEFLKSGVVVKQTNSDGTKDTLSVNRKGQLTTIPMVIIINKGSASASEIVAGALRDHDRAKIIGVTSFGKGSVQSPQELDGGSAVHITTGTWSLPKGDWINKKGITPDVEVKMDAALMATADAQLAKAIELLVQ